MGECLNCCPCCQKASELEAKLDAALVYAGVMSIEKDELMGLAISHGVGSWPGHMKLGEKTRDIIQMTHAEVKQRGRDALREEGEGDG